MEKIWLKNYPQGVPQTIDPDAYSSLVALLEKSVRDFPERIAFSNFGTAMTYREVWEKAQRLAVFFQQVWKLKKGDRLAVMMPNILQYPITLFAALMSGLIIVNTNPLYTPSELKHLLMDSQAQSIVVMENFAHTVAAVQNETELKNILVTKIGDLLGTLKKPIYNFVTRYVKRLVPAYSLSKVYWFEEALRQEASHLEKINLSHHDPAFLQYTGGTTGVPKSAVLTHRNIVANVLQCAAWLGTDLHLGKEKAIGALPFYHIFALTVCSFCFMVLGAECQLITNPRDLKQFVRFLKKDPPSIFVGVNTLFNGLLNQEDFCRLDFSHLKLTVSGGMSLQKNIAERWQALTGCPVIEGYGLTEASPVVAINPLNLKDFNGSIGLPVPSTDVSIRNEKNEELGIDQIGELLVKGPQVMQGYWNNPAETRKVLNEEGWLHTGDIARINSEGYIYLVDRKKDMIIVSGFNVYPNEVEAVLMTLPGVKEAAVIGVPSETTGEAVKAFIVLKDKTLTSKEIQNHCYLSLTHYKVPKLIEFRDELPKSNIGKVLRKKLRPEKIA